MRETETTPAREPTDEQIDAVLREHPIFGPVMRGEVTSYTVAPTYGVPPEYRVICVEVKGRTIWPRPK